MQERLDEPVPPKHVDGKRRAALRQRDRFGASRRPARQPIRGKDSAKFGHSRPRYAEIAREIHRRHRPAAAELVNRFNVVFARALSC